MNIPKDSLSLFFLSTRAHVMGAKLLYQLKSIAKGQKNSKFFFSSQHFFKKKERTNSFLLLVDFVHFLEESEDTKKTF